MASISIYVKMNQTLALKLVMLLLRIMTHCAAGINKLGNRPAFRLKMDGKIGSPILVKDILKDFEFKIGGETVGTDCQLPTANCQL
jgi:hypothetical protein